MECGDVKLLRADKKIIRIVSMVYFVQVVDLVETFWRACAIMRKGVVACPEPA